MRIAAVEGPLGPTIQIFDDDVVAFSRLIDLTLLLISTTFPYLCHCRLGGAEAYHADGSCHTNECNSDIAQSLLLDVHRLSVRSHRSALAPLPGGELRPITPGALARHISPNKFAPLLASLAAVRRRRIASLDYAAPSHPLVKILSGTPRIISVCPAAANITATQATPRDSGLQVDHTPLRRRDLKAAESLLRRSKSWRDKPSSQI